MGRLHEEGGFMASVLSMLHLTHDAMVSCLREPESSDAHATSLIESHDLFDPDLAKVASFTIAKIAPAIVTVLAPAPSAQARVRLAALLNSLRTRAVSIRLH